SGPHCLNSRVLHNNESSASTNTSSTNIRVGTSATQNRNQSSPSSLRKKVGSLGPRGLDAASSSVNTTTCPVGQDSPKISKIVETRARMKKQLRKE
ncbi:hypothetical protein AMTR_s00013p00080470, partial [Amborella trichopoda]